MFTFISSSIYAAFFFMNTFIAVLQLKGDVKEISKGYRTQEKIRKITSPPADIFLSGIPN